MEEKLMNKSVNINKIHRRLFCATLILFILFAATFPFVAGLTYSGRSESPDHILTYTKNKLTWDSGTTVDSNGVGELSVFEAEYNNVLADNGDNVVAPGTEGYDIVRLKNSVSGSIKYTAVLYTIKSSDELAVETSLSGTGFTDTSSYSLPDGVDESNVIRAVTGTLGGGKVQDFDIDWYWTFTEGNVQDETDTYLGNKSADGDPDDVTVGIYIIVEDNNKYVNPSAPKTGDDGLTGLYYTLFAICGFTLLILFLTRKRKDDEDKEQNATCES